MKLYLYSNLRWIGLLLEFWALVTSNKRPTRTRNDWIWPPYSLEAILKTRRSLTCQIQPAKEDERVTDLFRRILSQSASLFCKDRLSLAERAKLGKTSGKCHQRRENLNVVICIYARAMQLHIVLVKLSLYLKTMRRNRKFSDLDIIYIIFIYE